jgi:tight adherence protein B
MVWPWFIVMFGVAAVAGFAGWPPVAVAVTTRLNQYVRWTQDEYRAMCRELPMQRARTAIVSAMLGSTTLGLLAVRDVIGWPLAAIVGAAAGYLSPWLFVVYQRRRDLAALSNQWVDVLQMMASGFRAGLNVQLALELVARETKAPAANQFKRLLHDIEVDGFLIDQALQRFAERVPLEEVRLMVESVITLRTTGGNLGERFQIIAATIVERKRVAAKIHALTAAPRATGRMASAAPIAVAGIFSVVWPDHMRTLYETPLGVALLAITGLLCLTGLWLMTIVAKVDV